MELTDAQRPVIQSLQHEACTGVVLGLRLSARQEALLSSTLTECLKGLRARSLHALGAAWTGRAVPKRVQEELLSSNLFGASCGRLCQGASDAEHAQGASVMQHVVVCALNRKKLSGCCWLDRNMAAVHEQRTMHIAGGQGHTAQLWSL